MAESLYYRTLGEGRDLVMVHGWGMSSAIWLDFAEALASEYRVTCFDLPGHGLSQPIDSFTLDDISKVLLENAPEKAVWLGWSLGALVALHVASRYSQRVEALTMLAGNPRFLSADNWPGMDPSILDAFIEALFRDHHKTLLRFLALQGKGEVLRTLRQRVLSSPEPDYRTMEAGLSLLKNEDLREELALLKMPVQFLLGEADAVVPVGISEKVPHYCENAQIDLIHGGSHLPFLSNPLETKQAVQRFLKNHE